MVFVVFWVGKQTKEGQRSTSEEMFFTVNVEIRLMVFEPLVMLCLLYFGVYIS